MIVFAALLLATLQAQPAGAPLCKPTSTTLTNGVVVAVRSVGGNNPDLACEVSVRDRNGRSVFNDRGFDTAIHPATGRDIDNDGRPDVVVGVDTGGNDRCCWEYPVISF